MGEVSVCFFFIYFFRLHWSFLASCLVSVCASVFAWGGGEREGGGLFSLVSLVSLCPFLFPAHDAVFLFCYGIAIHVFQVEGFVILTVPGVMRVSYVVVPAATLQV